MAERQQHGRFDQKQAERFEGLSPRDRINAVLANTAPGDQRFMSRFLEQQCKLRGVQDLSENTSLTTFAFKVDRYYCNPSNNLHGGAQSAMYDVCTSIALQSRGRRDFWINGGVSRTLNVTYLRPAPEGEDLLLECEIVHTAKKLALLRGVLRRERDGAVISTCDHDKAAVQSKPGWKL